MLPTFLGIGAPKAGTTWLYQLLDSHPDVAMSQDRKEIHYFDLHFDRGRDWYERFFPAPTGRLPLAVGEFTTRYLYVPEVPSRVRDLPSVERFIVILRNPVDRAFSHYNFRRRQDNMTMTFAEFTEAEPDALALGRYAEHLARWFDEFGPEKVVVLVYETAVRDLADTRRRLGRHLGVDPALFPEERAGGAVNEAFVPRRSRLYAGAVQGARWLRRHDLDRVITFAKRKGVVNGLKRPRPTSGVERPSTALRAQLWSGFEADVLRLEHLTGLDLGLWRPSVPA